MQLQFNFNEKTKLSDWWKKVKENFQTVQDSFNGEASTRANADTVLEGKIAGVQSSVESETQNRQSSDENLQAQINDVRSANNTAILVGDTNRTLKFVAPPTIPELYWEEEAQYYGDHLSVDVDLHDAFFIDGRKIKSCYFVYDLHLDIGDNLSDFYVVAQYNFVTDQFDAYISREFVPSSVSGDVWTFSLYRYSGIQLEFKVSDDSPTGSYYVLESYGEYCAMPNEDSTGNTYTVSTSFERLRTKDYLATENKNSFLDAINEMTGNISDEKTERIAADNVLDNKISGKVDKVSGKGLSANDYTTAEKNKLAGIASGANNYTHPSSHAASMITQDSTHRFVTDSEKNTWNSKAPANHTHDDFLVGQPISEIKKLGSGLGSSICSLSGSIAQNTVYADFKEGRWYLIINETDDVLDLIPGIDMGYEDNYTILSASIPVGKAALVWCLKANDYYVTGRALVLFVN